MSPREAIEFRSPNEELLNWFRKHVETNVRSFMLPPEDDLRPDWSGVFAYGCRAYMLDKEREREENVREYKVQPRGKLGYLVGYKASNIYRIWIPELSRVITTRNVTFDE
ncbi:hypothetical protein C8A05DRAFT_36653, partial [Staphylotrichum tortipilum]